MTECSNCWQPISLIPGSCWWVYFTWRQLFLLLILLLLALAGGRNFTIAGTCWGVHFTGMQHLLGVYFTIAGTCWGFISLECSICWGSILLLLALGGGFF